MKKIICFMIAAALVMANSVFAVPSEEQLKDLKALEIMVGDEDGNMRLEDTITRAEAAKMICAIQGIAVDSFAENIESSAFVDVPDSHWAINYINCVKDLQIVQGDENGRFNPEASITNEEIIKMLIVALGYGPMAEQTGGYPMGYTRTAQKIGLMGDLKLKVDVPSVRGDVAMLFATALDIPLMAMSGWSADGNHDYVILDGSGGTEHRTLRIISFTE